MTLISHRGLGVFVHKDVCNWIIDLDAFPFKLPLLEWVSGKVEERWKRHLCSRTTPSEVIASLSARVLALIILVFLLPPCNEKCQHEQGWPATTPRHMPGRRHHSGRTSRRHCNDSIMPSSNYARSIQCQAKITMLHWRVPTACVFLGT